MGKRETVVLHPQAGRCQQTSPEIMRDEDSVLSTRTPSRGETDKILRQRWRKK